MISIGKLRRICYMPFDEKNEVKLWKRCVDYAIFFLILLSTAEIVLLTYPAVALKYEHVLTLIDRITTVFFTVEVTLRIWTCRFISPKYKGFKGLLRYCFSFYGLIDILSTYPFYLHYFVKIPYDALKILRAVRLVRAFRFGNIIKQRAAKLFDEKYDGTLWKKIVDGTIFFFILLSTAEIVLLSYPAVALKYEHVLSFIDYLTTIFFTLEVTLRIWTCGEINPKYKGFKGTLKYCFSFYGIIDILSTYSFYVSFFIKIPYDYLKILRIIRLVRAFRFAGLIRTKAANLFDDKNKDKTWYKIVDKTILFFILLNAVEVFLLTFPKFADQYDFILSIIDGITTAFFTIEVTLRIWTCGVIDPKYKGFRGMLRYCFSFYGLIDILSTYPFYLTLFGIAIPYTMLKVLRLARILRIFRFLNSFHILVDAAKAKRKEMLVSLQFLVIITVILGIILFFVEHNVQPDQFKNGFSTILWAFSQYLNDYSIIADYTPVTATGKAIAYVLGVLGIAIFAVPAGLIGSAFIEVIEERNKVKENFKNSTDLEEQFIIRSTRREGLFWPARKLSAGNIKIDLGIAEEDILLAVKNSQNLRIKNLANSIQGNSQNDILVINYFFRNNDYGACMDRKSSVTIVNPAGQRDNGLTYFTWHIARLGGFNYVGNEIFTPLTQNRERRCNFVHVDEDTENNIFFQKFVADIRTLSSEEKDWVVVITSEQAILNADSDFHFFFGGEKGEEKFDFPNSTVNNPKEIKSLFEDFSSRMHVELDLETDAHKVMATTSENLALYIRRGTKANVLYIFVSYAVLLWNNDFFKIITNFADILNKNLENNKNKGLNFDLYREDPLKLLNNTNQNISNTFKK